MGSKIDWHDWEMVGADLRRQGPGENGAAVKLTTGNGRAFINDVTHICIVWLTV